MCSDSLIGFDGFMSIQRSLKDSWMKDLRVRHHRWIIPNVLRNQFQYQEKQAQNANAMCNVLENIAWINPPNDQS